MHSRPDSENLIHSCSWLTTRRATSSRLTQPGDSSGDYPSGRPGSLLSTWLKSLTSWLEFGVRCFKTSDAHSGRARELDGPRKRSKSRSMVRTDLTSHAMGEDGDWFGDLIEDSKRLSQPTHLVHIVAKAPPRPHTLSERELVSMRFGLGDGQPKTLMRSARFT